MKQYEYKVIDKFIFIEKKLNKLGKEGWKLVCVVPIRSAIDGRDSFSQRYIFRRIKNG